LIKIKKRERDFRHCQPFYDDDVATGVTPTRQDCAYANVSIYILGFYEFYLYFIFTITSHDFACHALIEIYANDISPIS